MYARLLSSAMIAAWNQYPRRKSSLTKLIVLGGMLLAVVLLLYMGMAHARAWSAEKRENLTREAIIQNNYEATENLRVQTRYLLDTNARLAQRHSVRAEALSEAGAGLSAECDVPDSLLEFLRVWSSADVSPPRQSRK